MPNATARRARKAAKSSETNSNPTDTETTDMSTATATDTESVDYAALIEDTPEGYKPERSPAGRKRSPSPFDEVLPRVINEGWKKVPHDGTQEQVEDIKKNLQKSKQMHDLGMEMNVTDTHVEFKVRDKQKRKPRSKSVDNDVTELPDVDVETE